MRIYSVILFLFLVLKLQAFTFSNDSTISVGIDELPIELLDSLTVEGTVLDTFPPKVQNVIGFVPSQVTQINGWAIGWLLTDFDMPRARSSNPLECINGLYTNILPTNAFVAVLGAILAPVFAFRKDTYLGYFAGDTAYQIAKTAKRLNGATLSFVDAMDSYTVNGLEISAVLNLVSISNGVAVNGLFF